MSSLQSSNIDPDEASTFSVIRKILTILTFVALTVAVMPLIRASSVINDFTVTVTLAAQCRAMDSGTKTLNFGTYTAFQATPVNATAIEIGFECTRGLIPSDINFDSANGTTLGGGVLAGLNYDMNFAAPIVTSGNAATSTADDIGTADLRTYTISGTMAALQAGDVAEPASQTRTLILTY